MFTHMGKLVRKGLHSARSDTYELEVYPVIETGEHRVSIAKNGEGLDTLSMEGTSTDVVEILIQAAKDEIDRNEGGTIRHPSITPTVTRPCVAVLRTFVRSFCRFPSVGLPFTHRRRQLVDVLGSPNANS
jgi:hypothetical protein